MTRKIAKYITLVFVMLVISIFAIENVLATSNIIKLNNVEIYGKTAGVEAEIDEFTNDSVDTNILFHKIEDYVTYKLEIENTDSKDYTLKSVSNNSDSNYLVYLVDEYKDKEIKAHEKIEVLVSVKYNMEMDEDLKDDDYKVTFIFNLLSDEEEIEEEIPNVPITGDRIFIYISLLIISLIALLVIITINSKEYRNKKIIATVLLIALLIPCAIKAANAIQETSIITFNIHAKVVDKVKVIYDIEGEKEEKTINYNTQLKEPTEPKKTGHTFIGWYNGDAKFDFETFLTDDIELTAKFEMDTYNITYTMNGGNASNPNTYQIIDLPLALNNAEKPGYTFKGWKLGNNEPVVDLVITDKLEDLSLEAIFDIDNHTITYSNLTDEEKNSLNNRETYTIEDEFTLNNPANRLDEIGEVTLKFVGWKDKDGNVSKIINIANKNEDLTYEATWIHIKPGVYTIEYVLNDGNLNGKTNPNEFTKISDTIILNNPTREGYNFLGWTGSNGDTPSTNVRIPQGTHENQHFTANFELINYTVTYDLDGGTLTGTNPTSYTVNSTFTLVNPTKRGYHFDGWVELNPDTNEVINPANDNVTVSLNSKGNRKYKAQYTIYTYNLEYVIGDGTVNPANPLTYNVTDTITLNNPTLVNHTFAGWIEVNPDTGEDITTTPSQEVVITDSIGNRKFRAVYVLKSYTVVFNKNDDGAEGTMSDQLIALGSTVALNENKFTKEGYNFIGWTKNQDGSGTVYADQEPVTNLLDDEGTITLYAKWQLITKAYFAKGDTVNQKMKRLAGQSTASSTTVNNNILKVKYYSGEVDPIYQTDNNKVSDASSAIPIYMWFDSSDGIIYYGSEATDLYLKDGYSMFRYLENVTEIDTHFHTDDVTNMTQMFFADHHLETLDVSNFNVDNVQYFTSMFGENFKVKELDVSKWTAKSGKNMNYMFNQCYEITELDVRNFETENVTSMQNTFSSTWKLTSLKMDPVKFDTSNVTNMKGMFDNMDSIEELDLSHFKTSKVTTFQQFLENAYSLRSVTFGPEFKTTSATNMKNMFSGCGQTGRDTPDVAPTIITELDISGFDTKKVTNMSGMFSCNPNLETIYVSTLWSLEGIKTSVYDMFKDDFALVGGQGSSFATYHNIKSKFAHIDEGTSNPGYFTQK